MNNFEELKEIHKKQKEFFLSGITKKIDYRIENLKKLKKVIIKYENEIYKAIYEDLGKNKYDTYATEIGIVLAEIDYMLKNIKKLAKARKVKTELFLYPSEGYIYYEPYGNVLIISPWNYPFQLSLNPLVGAIATGNTIILKPSRSSKHTSQLIKKIIAEAFDERLAYVFYSEEIDFSELLDLKFDYIFFTGSPDTGRKVMEKASKNLTPITLELGGKSPALILEDADIDLAAKKIIWGKTLNAGQTCIAPDYTLVPFNLKDFFITRLIYYIDVFYGKDIINNENYSHIINRKQFERILKLLENTKIVFGGEHNIDKLFISPTIVDNPDWDSPIMKEEIFAPVLPVIGYNSLDELLKRLKNMEKPLAFYIFGRNNKIISNILSEISFGGGCINDVLIHSATNKLPFGGVGNSGIGKYHGKYSFETFSNKKSVLYRKKGYEENLRYPPHKEFYYWFLKTFLK